MSATAKREPATGVSWDLRLRNWARWANNASDLPGCQVSRLTPESKRVTPDEADAQAVERLLCRMKQHRKPLYRGVWQTYLMRRDDVTAAEVLRVGPTEYRARLEAAWRWLAMAERGAVS